MKAGDVMSGAVVGVRQDAPLAQALRLMVQNHISGLPVLDEAGHPVGMLTEGDLLRRAEIGTEGGKPGKLRMFLTPGRIAGDYVRTHGRIVSELMTPEVETVQENTPLDEVVERMRTRRVKRLPVTRNGVVVGIVSRADLIRTLSDSIDAPDRTLGDAAIQEEILKGLAVQSWSSYPTITVSVANGTVALDGVVYDLRQRDAAQVIAENASGTKSVENRLICVEPMSGIIVLDPAVEQDGYQGA